MGTLQELKRAAQEFTQHVVVAVDDDDDDDDIGELEVGEYVILLFAFDTYIRYIEETLGVEDPRDAVIAKGMKVIRLAEKEMTSLREFLDEQLPSESHKRMLARAMRRRVTTPEMAGERAMDLRDLLQLGGARTQRAVFKTNKMLKQIRVADAAAEMDDADAALDKFSALLIRNPRIRAWIDLAAKMAGSAELPELLGVKMPTESVQPPTDELADSLKRDRNPVDQAAKQGTDETPKLLAQNVESEGAAGPEAIHEAESARASALAKIESDATEAARKAIETSGGDDSPPTRSETVGVAVAAATAVAADSSNIPEPLKGLDDEQRAAALTDGRVLVAAGAGAGKSTTLVARVKLLIEDRRVTPSRVLVTSFNKKAADELKDKIGGAVGKDRAGQMSVGTMHSLFRSFIEEFGTEEEAVAVRNARPSGFVGTGSNVARTVQKMWSECFDPKERPKPKLKDAKRLMEQWVGNDVTPGQARESAGSQTELDAAEWYEMYEGLKGAIPGWEPPCEERAREVSDETHQQKVQNAERYGRRPPRARRPTSFEAFMGKNREGGMRLGDFNDMIRMFRDILKRDDGARTKVQRMFDHILIDECQDLNSVQHEAFELMTQQVTDGSDGKSLWMVGDDKQCVAADTLVAVPGGGVTPAAELRPGQSVMSYRNGKLVEQQVRHVEKTNWTEGFKITTDTGKTLTMSPNHKIWARAPELEDEQVAVYLMYRRDMGFRVGTTNKCHSEDYYNSFGGRAYMEKAERMWVLDICDDREKALLAEQTYALTYGIPTMVFGGENRGINQERVDILFSRFGKNGGRTLEDKHLSFDLPHWMSQSYTKHGRLRRTIQMTAHGGKGTQVALEWTGDDLDRKLEGVRFVTTGERRRLRKWFTDYRAALEFAEDLQRRTEANLSRRLSTDDGPVRLTTASGLFPGMLVVAPEGDGTTLETIVTVDKVEGVQFIDLDVDDASNFIGNGILSHNSIYGFRGARPDLFTGLDGKEGWKTRMIRTNYRCEPEIVEAANALIGHNQDQIPMEANPNPTRSRGVGSIKVEEPPDDASGALATIERIKGETTGMAKEEREAFLKENAVLCRTNDELHAYETSCIVRGIPYARKGSGSFLGSPETTAVLGYVQLVTGTDFAKMQKSLGSVLVKPNRFFISPKDAPEMAEGALRDYARTTGQDLKSINPSQALRDKGFQTAMAKRLLRLDAQRPVPRGKSFQFDKTMEQLSELGGAIGMMQANAEDEKYTTENLFDEILSLPGRATAVDPDTGKTIYIEQTFRESLQSDLRDRDTGDDDEDESEGDEQNLGNVGFLYALAQTDPTDPGDLDNPPGTPGGFADKMARYASRMRELRHDLNKVKPGETPPAVYLGTVHSTKGAQWENTYVQMPAGKFPMQRKPKPGEPPPDPDVAQKALEDERRLAYVAVTRAKKNLTIVCPSRVGGLPAGRSFFVDEAQLQTGENVPKGGMDAPEEQPDNVPPDPQLAAEALPDDEIEILMDVGKFSQIIENAGAITPDQLDTVIGPKVQELMSLGAQGKYKATAFMIQLLSANPNLAGEGELPALQTALENYAELAGEGPAVKEASEIDWDPLIGPPPDEFDEGGAA